MNHVAAHSGPDNYEFLAEIDSPPDELFATFNDAVDVEDESSED